MTQTPPANQGTVLEVTEARQGRRGRHALWILVVSTILVALALWGAWAFKAPKLASVSDHGLVSQSAAQKFDTTPAQPHSAPADNPAGR